MGDGHPSVTYLSFDGLDEGVGASQVLPYVERLAAEGVDVTLYSFEKSSPSPALRARLAAAGIGWHPQAFGRAGSVGGLVRVFRAARLIRGATLVHARSDLAAAAALLGRPTHWVWDMRSFWADQRIALGMLREGSVEDRILRRVERGAARSSSAIITLAGAAVDVLDERHGGAVRDKSTVITTCVDLDKFAFAAAPPTPPVRFLLSGTLNAYYDVPTMLRLFEAFRSRQSATLSVLTPEAGPWVDELRRAGASIGRAAPGEMAGHLVGHHVGLSVCRMDAGVSLRAAMPTKIGEFLATGRPVVVNRGLGDLDALIAEFRCGVVVDSSRPDAIESAAIELVELLVDPDLPGRCRQLAEAHFDLQRGVDRLVAVYEAAVARGER